MLLSSWAGRGGKGGGEGGERELRVTRGNGGLKASTLCARIFFSSTGMVL